MVSSIDFNKIFDEYNEIMIFASSNKHKLAQMGENGLSKDNPDVSHQIEFINYQLPKIGAVLDEIDKILADYYQLDIEIEINELNDMERELLGVQKEYSMFLDALNK